MRGEWGGGGRYTIDNDYFDNKYIVCSNKSHDCQMEFQYIVDTFF